ncbi:MAG TPA: helix-turn-helix transcriptional regulator [Bacilli bacterium]
MHFYEGLKKIRKMRGYTIREVSKRSGVSHGYISQLENGVRNVPSPEILLKLADALEYSYEELMKIAGYLAEDPEQEAADKPVNLRRILRSKRVVLDGMELSGEDKEWIERILTVLFWRRKPDDKTASSFEY